MASATRRGKTGRGAPILSAYVQAALGRIEYESDESGNKIGTIRGVAGPIAYGKTFERCREQMTEVLEEWLLVKLRHNDVDFPVLDGIDLNPPGGARRSAGRRRREVA